MYNCTYYLCSLITLLKKKAQQSVALCVPSSYLTELLRQVDVFARRGWIWESGLVAAKELGGSLARQGSWGMQEGNFDNWWTCVQKLKWSQHRSAFKTQHFLGTFWIIENRMGLNITHTLMFIDYSPLCLLFSTRQKVVNLNLNYNNQSYLLIVTFPAETAAPTEAKSVLAIFVQKLHKSEPLCNRENIIMASRHHIVESTT